MAETVCRSLSASMEKAIRYVMPLKPPRSVLVHTIITFKTLFNIDVVLKPSFMRAALMRDFYKMKCVWIKNTVRLMCRTDVLYICSFIFSFQHLPFFVQIKQRNWTASCYMFHFNQHHSCQFTMKYGQTAADIDVRSVSFTWMSSDDESILNSEDCAMKTHSFSNSFISEVQGKCGFPRYDP